MAELRRYSIHGLLALETNLPGPEVPKAFETHGPVEPGKLVRALEAEPDIDFRALRPLGLRLFVGDGVLVHRCLSYGRLVLVLRDLTGSGGPTEVIFNRPYRIFRELVRGESTWHFIKLVLMARLLLSASTTFAHASAVAKSGRAMLFTGWSDVGKTSTAVGLVRATEGELSYMASDITLIGPNGAVLAWPTTPRTVLARPFERVPFLRKLVVRGRPMLPSWAGVELRAVISHVFFLEPSREEGARELNPEEAFRRLVLSTDMAFNPFSNQLLLAYSHAEPSFDLLALRERHLGLLRELISKAECVELRARGPEGFVRQALALI